MIYELAMTTNFHISLNIPSNLNPSLSGIEQLLMLFSAAGTLKSIDI